MYFPFSLILWRDFINTHILLLLSVAFVGAESDFKLYVCLVTNYRHLLKVLICQTVQIKISDQTPEINQLVLLLGEEFSFSFLFYYKMTTMCSGIFRLRTTTNNFYLE